MKHKPIWFEPGGCRDPISTLVRHARTALFARGSDGEEFAMRQLREVLRLFDDEGKAKAIGTKRH